MFFGFFFKLIKFFFLFPFYHPYLFFLHLIINLLFAIFIYLQLAPFYDKSKKEIHEKYPEFCRVDKINFYRLYLGLVFLVWPRAISFVILMTIMAIVVNLGKNINDPKQKPYKDKVYSLGSLLVLYSLGFINIKIIRNDEKAKEIYKKYLGPDYEIDYNKKFVTVLCNHTSWVESYFFNYYYCAGYIGKKSASKIPGIKQIGVYNQTIYVDRTDKESREKTAKAIEERQKNIYNGTNLTHLAIYPEGTTTNGKYLIKFKRGAFMTLLPLKPWVQLVDQNEESNLSVGPIGMHWHMVYTCCFFWHNDIFLELPVVEPTDFMYENYKDLGSEKWMIYMEVTKKIMAETAGLLQSEKSHPEKFEYMSLITGKKIKNT